MAGKPQAIVGVMPWPTITKGASHAPAAQTVATGELSAETGVTNYVTHISMSLDDGATSDLPFTLTNVKGTSAAITLKWDLPAGSTLSIDFTTPVPANAANLAMVLASDTPAASQKATIQILGFSM